VAAGKKNAARRRALIVFLDESGFSEVPSLRRTWAPRGKTPVLVHRFGRWTRLSAIGALAYAPRALPPRAPRVFLALQTESVRSAHLIRFLSHLHRHVRCPVVLLWDNLNTHRSAEIRDYLAARRDWLRIERLPAYAPELNPVEGMWSWDKGFLLPNFAPDGLAPIRRVLRNGQRHLHRHPDRIVGFLHKSGLSL
jgi:hypothetical protein